MNKYSRLGIGVLIAVWATVLLVPSLHQILRAQLPWSQSFSFSFWPEERKPSVHWGQLAQRYPRDKSLLLQAALESPELERNEIVGWEKLEPPFPPSEMDENGIITPPPDKAPLTIPIFRHSSLFPGTPVRDYQGERLRRLAQLVEKYPRDVVLLAVYLKNALPLRFGRLGGELDDFYLEENQKAGKPSPEVNADKSPYSAADLERALEFCARGQRLEPNNGFFDWMRCIFLMLAWRDAQALQALDAAAGKQRFDDYFEGAILSSFIANSQAKGRELLVEEKQQLFLEINFSEFARFRQAARLLAWQSVKARRRGDHRQALQIAGSLMRTAVRFRDNQRTEIGFLVGTGLEALARSGPLYDERKPLRQLKQKYDPEQFLRQFQAYAVKHGRADLATEATRNSAVRQAVIETQKERLAAGIVGVTFANGLAIKGLWAIGLLLLLFLPLALFAGGLIGGILHRTSKSNSLPPNEIPSRREVWNGALACGGLRALLPFLLLAVIIIYRPWKWKVPGLWSEDITPLAEFYYALTMSTSWLSPLFYFLALSPLLYGGLFAAWRATEWQKRANGEKNKPSLLLKIAGFIGIGLLSLVWIALALSPTDSLTWLWALGFVLLFAGLLLAEKYFVWRKRPRKRAALRYGWLLLQQSLLAWVVLGSVLYLLASAASLPFRHSAAVGLQKTLTIGEVQMSGVLGKFKNK